MAVRSIASSAHARQSKTAFDCMVEDLFNNPELMEWCEVDGKEVSCIASALTESPSFTAFGTDYGVSFFLRFLESDWKQLGDVRHITYRGRCYRIVQQELDSAGLTRHIYLKSSEEPLR